MKLLILAVVLLMTVSVFPQNPSPLPLPLEPGVSQMLARWRAAHYSDVRYGLNITLEKGAPLMKGEMKIRVKLTREGTWQDLTLDWRTTQFQNDKDKPSVEVVEVNERVIKKLLPSGNFDYAVDKEHLIVAQRLLKEGENVIKLRFASPIKTSGAAVTRYVDKTDGAEYVYSLFVPSDASTAFPVFDQPDLKARFALRIKKPDEWKVISNTAQNRVQRLTTTHSEDARKNLSEILFEETQPISTYVFAFAAGNFAEFEDTKRETISSESIEEAAKNNGLTTRIYSGIPKIYVRKSQTEKFKQHAAETFRLNREAVKFLESYFDFKFPFPKYDLVLIPEFPFGGMEHAGSTFLRETSVIFPSEPTANDFISRANLIFHEAAHQWFGDTVTMKWFDDLWLKEGFAEYMAYKTLEKVMPEYNAWKAFYERNKPLAYLTDSTRGTTPIYQEIPNLSAAKSAYGNIVYRKAPSFLRQAEFYLGEDKFQSAVRRFLKNHQYSNAEWTDLVKEFETASGQDLKDWANVWVKKRGTPIFRTTRTDKQGKSFIKIEQKDVLNEGSMWIMNFNYLSRLGKDIYNEMPVRFNKDTSFVTIETRTGPSLDYPDFVFPNYQDYGYGIFLLDDQSRAYVLENIQNEKDDFLRSMMWGTLWDSVREAELNPRDYVELAIKNISVEQDELTIQTILSRVSTAMNYYLPDAERDRLAPQLENLLIDKIQNAPTLGKRITFYRAFLGVAASENARTVLKQILSEDLGERGGDTKMRAGSRTDAATGKIVHAANPAIPLRTKDRFDIVTRLLILGDKDAPRLLAELERNETSDEARRYAYAARAGIGTIENKARAWNDFVNNREISESWIEAAFVPFNSSRHSQLTLPYLERALAELPALKRSRKIFFVNGWLSAFIGGQKSEEASRIVNKFLADNPTLDRDLRLKILENADGLERAVKIRAKYR